MPVDPEQPIPMNDPAVTSVRVRLSALHGSDRGSAIVELAVALPMLVMLVVGAADFARVFYFAHTLTNAARAGAQYGIQEGKYTQTANMESTATSAAGTIPIDAEASYLCQCATDTAYTSTPPTGGCASCSGTGQHLVIQVTVTTSSTFNTI